MSKRISIDQLNLFSRQNFVDSLADIYEHSPWVAEQVFALRPFSSRDELEKRMYQVVLQASDDQHLTLICNHPELAGKEAAAGTLTAASTREQAGAGLDQCSRGELDRLQSLNLSYRNKFGFPFVIAVTGLNKTDIIAALESRLQNDILVEIDTSIKQIGRIARIRLNALIDE